MKRLQEALRDYLGDDHARGCSSRHAACECGYDEKGERLMRQAANRIEDLESEVRRLRGGTDEQDG